MSITALVDQHRTIRQMQRALRKNPYDTNALWQLATLPGGTRKSDLDQKRRLLHRILYLEPTHKPARQMLFELDRATIGGDVSRLSAAVILTDPAWGYPPERPLVLKYSIVHRFLVYAFLAGIFFAGVSMIRALEILVMFTALLLVPLWSMSAVIEISDAALKISRLFGLVSLEVPWREIREFKQSAMGKGIRIITCQGKVVEVPAGIQGYSFILDILQQMRPDLFQLDELPGTHKPPGKNSAVTPLGRRRFR